MSSDALDDDDDDLDAWPAFVDVLTSAVMFLLISFVALVVAQIHAARDRVARDADQAQKIGTPIETDLKLVLSQEQGAECKRRDWEVICAFEDKLTFDAGKAELRSDEARLLLGRFGEALKSHLDRGVISQIIVEGHTDPVPFNVRGWSNWELSSARAGHIVRFLKDSAAIPGEVLQAVGYAEYKPPHPNATFEEQRFVAIRVRVKGSLLDGKGPAKP